MPLHRSARLFTLGLALAGTCAAQNPLETEQNPAPQQQKAGKSAPRTQLKPGQPARKPIFDRSAGRSAKPA
jgi:hypothetical protein